MSKSVNIYQLHYAALDWDSSTGIVACLLALFGTGWRRLWMECNKSTEQHSSHHGCSHADCCQVSKSALCRFISVNSCVKCETAQCRLAGLSAEWCGYCYSSSTTRGHKDCHWRRLMMLLLCGFIMCYYSLIACDWQQLKHSTVKTKGLSTHALFCWELIVCLHTYIHTDKFV